jgi:hypothetical protein
MVDNQLRILDGFIFQANKFNQLLIVLLTPVSYGIREKIIEAENIFPPLSKSIIILYYVESDVLFLDSYQIQFLFFSYGNTSLYIHLDEDSDSDQEEDYQRDNAQAAVAG